MSVERRREPVSIEELLVWAYADQRVHQARRTPVELSRGGGPLAAHSSLWTECAPVDGGRNVGFDAADDAWRVHAEVMKLKPVVLDLGPDLRAARYHALGQYRGAAPPTGKPGNADASANVWPVDGVLRIDVQALVMIHATRASRPEKPMPPLVRYKPAETVWHPKRRSKVYARGWFCHVSAVGNLPGDVAADAQAYRAWWEALAGLQARMRATQLTMWSVTQAMPPRL